MKYVLFVIATLLCSISFSQVAIIQDKDGYTNVRKEPSSKAEIIHRIYDNEVFWYHIEGAKESSDWVPVYLPKDQFSLGCSEESMLKGYIHTSRLRPFEKMEKYTGDAFRFAYELQPFDPNGKIIDKLPDAEWISAINGLHFWGTAGQLPKTEIKAIKASIEGKEIPIHKAFYADIFECDNPFDIYQNDDTYFVYQFNSDGAGAYELVWVITKDGLVQRLVGTIF